jgi:hypothetical protein
VNAKYDKTPKISPLHTSKAIAAVKAEMVRSLGKDKDGAYRFARRLDGLN